MDTGYHEDNYQNKITMAICYGMRILVLIAAGLFFLWGDWESSVSTVIIFILMLTPSFLKERYRLHLPFALEIGVVAFIFITLFLGHLASFYDYIPFWDKFVHLQSGILLGATGFIIIYILNENKSAMLNLSPGFIAVFAITFSLALGAVWEIVEFVGDSIFGSAWQASNTDTMWDLIADIIGSLIVSITGYFWMYRHKRLPFTPWFVRIFKTNKNK
ncbi:MAG: hypothetical protein UT05_C0001G0047 [Parcubacteria group bacterium GW2011_GWF2_38_76]|nr:MAG: hypothetical protein UT05_C0001G0047 [Parcubacteria group bacterium GW2011_GWF2_38_76]HBM45976.1 hypothetical protein [Patescibacteria group bacterium]